MGQLISVIMSTYNEELSWIEESIESILKQTYENMEFIIVVDNPDNESLNELVCSYRNKDSRVTVVKNEKNLGLTASLNLALSLAKGEYIARMDADDISALDRLEKQLKYITEKKLDYIFSDKKILNEAGVIEYHSANRELSPKEVNILCGRWNVSTHPTWFLKKSVYSSLGGYRDIPYCEDYDFLLRAALCGVKMGRMPDSTLIYRKRESSISTINSLEQFQNARCLRRFYRGNRLDDIKALEETFRRNEEYSKCLSVEDLNRGIQLVHLGKNDIKELKILKGIASILRGCSVSPLVAYKYIDWAMFVILDKSLRVGKFLLNHCSLKRR